VFVSTAPLGVQPAPTGDRQVSAFAQTLWERVHPRKGRYRQPQAPCHIPKPSNALLRFHIHYLGEVTLQGRNQCLGLNHTCFDVVATAWVSGPGIEKGGKHGACSPVHCCQSVEGWIGQKCPGLSTLGCSMALNRCWGFAGKPAPTGFVQCCRAALACRSGLAREEVGQTGAAAAVGRLTCGCDTFAAAPSSMAC
jgi:hypothetical protein